MTEAEILWNNIRLRANGREAIPREEIEDMLETYAKDVWKELFDRSLVGYANGELVIDVSRETLEAAPVEVTDF